MIKKVFIVFFILISAVHYSQTCKEQLVHDSIFKPTDHKKVAASYIYCKLKNGGNIKLINHNGRYYLMMVLNEKMGLEEVGNLEIKSGGRSFFTKNVTLYNIKENDSYFFIEIMINYVGTLKEDGISSVVFCGKFEAKLSKEDSNNVRKGAKCFYELHKK